MKNLPAKIVGTVVNAKERGATAVEYGIMVALIAAVIITIVATLGGQLSTMFQGISDEVGKAG
jgi:pilus assembly protein Flp/PilA